MVAVDTVVGDMAVVDKDKGLKRHKPIASLLDNRKRRPGKDLVRRMRNVSTG